MLLTFNPANLREGINRGDPLLQVVPGLRAVLDDHKYALRRLDLTSDQRAQVYAEAGENLYARIRAVADDLRGRDPTLANEFVRYVQARIRYDGNITRNELPRYGINAADLTTRCLVENNVIALPNALPPRNQLPPDPYAFIGLNPYAFNYIPGRGFDIPRNVVEEHIQRTVDRFNGRVQRFSGYLSEAAEADLRAHIRDSGTTLLAHLVTNPANKLRVDTTAHGERGLREGAMPAAHRVAYLNHMADNLVVTMGRYGEAFRLLNLSPVQTDANGPRWINAREVLEGIDAFQSSIAGFMEHGEISVEAVALFQDAIDTFIPRGLERITAADVQPLLDAYLRTEMDRIVPDLGQIFNQVEDALRPRGDYGNGVKLTPRQCGALPPDEARRVAVVPFHNHKVIAPEGHEHLRPENLNPRFENLMRIIDDPMVRLTVAQRNITIPTELTEATLITSGETGLPMIANLDDLRACVTLAMASIDDPTYLESSRRKHRRAMWRIPTREVRDALEERTRDRVKLIVNIKDKWNAFWAIAGAGGLTATAVGGGICVLSSLVPPNFGVSIPLNVLKSWPVTGTFVNSLGQLFHNPWAADYGVSIAGGLVCLVLTSVAGFFCSTPARTSFVSMWTRQKNYTAATAVVADRESRDIYPLVVSYFKAALGCVRALGYNRGVEGHPREDDVIKLSCLILNSFNFPLLRAMSEGNRMVPQIDNPLLMLKREIILTSRAVQTGLQSLDPEDQARVESFVKNVGYPFPDSADEVPQRPTDARARRDYEEQMWQVFKSFYDERTPIIHGAPRLPGIPFEQTGYHEQEALLRLSLHTLNITTEGIWLVCTFAQKRFHAADASDDFHAALTRVQQENSSMMSAQKTDDIGSQKNTEFGMIFQYAVQDVIANMNWVTIRAGEKIGFVIMRVQKFFGVNLVDVSQQ